MHLSETHDEGVPQAALVYDLALDILRTPVHQSAHLLLLRHYLDCRHIVLADAEIYGALKLEKDGETTCTTEWICCLHNAAAD